VQNDGDGKNLVSRLQAMELSVLQARLALLITSVAIFGLALLPAHSESPTLFGADKIKHMGAFVMLALLARASWPLWPLWRLALGLAAFGAAIELAQGLSGLGRTASFADLVADLIGIGLGFALLWGVRKLRAKKHATVA
jgi:VanZ family protein